MPFRVTERDITSPYSRRMMTASPTGQRAMFERPDPNDAMATYARSHPAIEGLRGAQFGIQPFGNPMSDPRQGVSAAGLSAQADQLDAAKAQQWAQMRQRDVEAGNLSGSTAMHQNALTQQNQLASNILGGEWRPFLQSLYNAGADRLASGARMGMGGRGFFDTQQAGLGTMDAVRQATTNDAITRAMQAVPMPLAGLQRAR